MTTLNDAVRVLADRCYEVAHAHEGASVISLAVHADADGRHVLVELNTGDLIGSSWNGPEDDADAEMICATAAGVALFCGSLNRELSQ